jgi:hypothetical protein
VNVVALRALKRAEVETHACRHDAGKHHVGMALWASRAMDLSVDVIGQEIGFLHDASLRGGGSATLSVTGNMPVKQRGDRNNFRFHRRQFAVQNWSVCEAQ